MTRTRKPRKKATTDLGRSILQRERQRLAREQAVLSEKAEADRKERLATKRSIQRHSSRDANELAFERSVVRRIVGVLASEGVVLPITTQAVSSEDGINAWTDFSQIFVGYHVFDDVKLTAATMRGLFYHEGGHCRFTLPWPDLMDMAAAAYGLSNQGELLSSTVARGFSMQQLQRSWNALEDQRMETAVVSDSPRKAAYFTPVMLHELAATPDQAAANYPLMIWRRYLPAKIRKGAREAFLYMHGADGPDLDLRFRDTVTRYVLGTEVREMFEAVVDMAALLDQHRVALDLDAVGHQRQGNGYRYSKGNRPDLDIPVDPSMEADTGDEPSKGAQQNADKGKGMKNAPSEGGSSGTHESDDAGMTPEQRDEQQEAEGIATPDEDEAEGSKGSKADDSIDDDDDSIESSHGGEGDESDEDEADDEDGGSDGGSSGTHDDEDEGLTQDDLDDAIQEAEAERMEDHQLDGDAQAFQDARDMVASNLPVYTGGVDTHPAHVAAATILSDQLKHAFEAATVDEAPSWHEEQRRGIINVNRYATRRPGDVEFFRNYVDEGSPGFDMSVSLLLDYSGSMGGVVNDLAQVAYACKTACQDLGIPCTVVLWDTDARTLWDAQERAEHLPVIRAAGGTNPLIALSDLDNQGLGKAKHIVLIMTDDAWSGGSPSLSSYKAEGRTLIGIGYGSDAIRSSMASRGADFAHGIGNLSEIAAHLRDALIASV